MSDQPKTAFERDGFVWRSVVDIPRDGTVVAVLFKDSDEVITADALYLGVVDHGDGEEEAWCSPGTGGVYDYAKAMDPLIIGWFPVPQIAGWPLAERFQEQAAP